METPAIGRESARTQGIDDLPTVTRMLRGVQALAELERNTDDTELALVAAVLLNRGRIGRLLEECNAQPEGRELLRTRPALDREHCDLDALAQLPSGTLGRSYADFMRERGLSPEVFVAPPSIRDEDVRYFAQRLRQTHDLWHVLTGYNTDLMGEIELQAFMYGQLRTPFSLLVAALGLLRNHLSRANVARVWAAYQRGKRAEPMAYRLWEQQFTRALAEVRAAMHLN
jgi:ubiquinone biosynthesis protein COQ4